MPGVRRDGQAEGADVTTTGNGERARTRERRGAVNDAGFVSWSSDAVRAAVRVFESVRADGWANALTGLGEARDKRLSSVFRRSTRITQMPELLEELFYGDDLVATIAELPALEATRAWIDVAVQGDAEAATAANQWLETIGAQTSFAGALTWARLYGGSVILVGADDGQDPSLPLDEDAIKTLDWLTVLDRFDVEVNSTYSDPTKPGYGEPETYRLTSSADFQGGTFNRVVHESRVLRFDGTPTGARRRRQNAGWSESVLTRSYDVVRDFHAAFDGIAHLLTDFSQGIYKIKGLAQMLAHDKDDVLRTRLQALDLARSVVRAIPLDADGEDFERRGAQVSGLSDLADRMMMRVSSATRIPVTLLFGRSPAGLNATGESDIRLFYDHISTLQETVLRPLIERLLTLAFLAKDGPTAGVVPESWSFVFLPLFQPTEQEQAATRLAHAQADSIYLASGALSAREVAESRFGGDRYGTEIALDEDARAAELDEELRLALAAGARPPTGDRADDLVGEESAPNYGAAVGEKLALGQVCARCGFADGSFCRRWDFSFDVGYRCDDWIDGAALVKLAREARRR